MAEMSAANPCTEPVGSEKARLICGEPATADCMPCQVTSGISAARSWKLIQISGVRASDDAVIWAVTLALRLALATEDQAGTHPVG